MARFKALSVQECRNVLEMLGMYPINEEETVYTSSDIYNLSYGEYEAPDYCIRKNYDNTYSIEKTFHFLLDVDNIKEDYYLDAMYIYNHIGGNYDID